MSLQAPTSSSKVVLRVEGGSVELGDAGLSLKPWFSRREVRIPWVNVMFVSPVPAVRHDDQGWRTFRDEPLSAETLRRSVKFYCFEIALHDRHAVLAGVGTFTRFWLLAGFGLWVRPLYVDEDIPHQQNGCLRLYFPGRWVRKNGEALLAALEITKQHSRFDLLITID